MLKLAYESLKIQKSAPAVLNAANEVAVEAFLNNKIKFVSIPKIVEKTLNKTSFYELNSIKDVIKQILRPENMQVNSLKQNPINF